MAATVPFRLWIEQGCPAVFDWNGTPAEANDALLYEYDAIAVAGPQPLEDWECDKLGLPRGTTNADAHRKLRETWPMTAHAPPRPSGR
jgi:hypothetical protein